MSGPRQARELLGAILEEAGSSAKRSQFTRVLHEVLGPEIAPRSQVIGYRRGRLVVEIDSAPLCAELTGFRREEIRAACNHRLADKKIAEIVFRMGGTGHV